MKGRWMDGIRGFLPVAGLALAAASCSVVGAPSPRAPSGSGAGPVPERVGGAVAVPGTHLPGAAALNPLRPFREVRGLWVVRSTMTSPGEVREMVRRAREAGFNTLIVQVRGRGDAFYRSRWEPRGETVQGPPEFDPLALAVEEAHARGMAVHAWVNTHLVWGVGEAPRSPEHLLRAHPDWLAVPRELATRLFDVDPFEPRFVEALRGYAQANPNRVEGIYSSPSHPAVKERVYSVWMDLVNRYDLDGIHFDYVRFPSPRFDYSRGALERFRLWVAPRLSPRRRKELEAAYRSDPLAFVEALAGPWDEFRRRQITELVERIYYGVKARRPRLIVSAAVFANDEDAYLNRFQNWPAWLARGILDVAVPMAYTTEDDVFRRQIRTARGAAGIRERVWAGIGAYRNGVEGTLSKIRIAREEGAGGVVLFSYDWAVEEGSPDGERPFLERIGAAAFENGG